MEKQGQGVKMGERRTRKRCTSSSNKRLLVRSEEIHHVLPREIMSEILVRVPAQFLIELKIVCKFWRNLISDPTFVNAHLSHHRCNSQQVLGIRKLLVNSYNYFSFHLGETSNYFSMDLGDTGKRLDRCSLHLPDCIKGNTRKLHDSCNGLLLIETWDKEKQFWSFSVCNPITRRYTKFSSPFGPYNSHYWALACDASTHKYKVIGFGFRKCLIFTLGEQVPRIRWRKIPTPHKKYYILDESISAYGELHWLVKVFPHALTVLDDPSSPSELYIYSLDATKEEFRKTQVKPYNEKWKDCNYYLFGLNGSLCIANLVSENQLDIWTLVDNINCLWNKNHSIHLENELGILGVYGYPSSDSCQKKILINQWSKLYAIDFNKKKGSLVYELEGPGVLESMCYFFHTNSLVNWK